MSERNSRQFALDADALLSDEQYETARASIARSAEQAMCSLKDYFADHLVETLTSLFDMTTVKESFPEDTWNAAFGREIKQILILRRLLLEESNAHADIVQSQH